MDLENTDIIEFLIKKGANPDAKDLTGTSPRDEAAMSDEILKLL